MRCTGIYSLKADEKGRVKLPKRILNNIGSGELYIVHMGTGRYRLYSPSEWADIMKEMDQLPREDEYIVKRKILGGCNETMPDAQGRILLNRLNNCDEKALFLVGAGRYCEIYTRSEWERIQTGIKIEEAEALTNESKKQ